MGVFNIFSKLNINEGVKKFRQTPNAILLDVRTEEVYTRFIPVKAPPLKTTATAFNGNGGEFF